MGSPKGGVLKRRAYSESRLPYAARFLSEAPPSERVEVVCRQHPAGVGSFCWELPKVMERPQQSPTHSVRHPLTAGRWQHVSYDQTLARN